MLCLITLLSLAGCGSTPRRRPTIAGVPDPGPSLDLSCVPYARQRSGIDLRGDAWQWWTAAEGRYQRGQRPARGSVLVIARTRRLPSGHLAVVSRIVSPREIRVDHANWANGSGRGRVARDQPVLDVSPNNDWTAVRVWYPGAADYGNTVFASQGFIHPRLDFAGR